jgi:hypothetical protein
VSLEGAVRLLAEPGPAVAPVVPEPLGDTVLVEGDVVVAGAVLAPPVAAPGVAARASRMHVSRSMPVMVSQRLVAVLLRSPAAAFGSPALCGVGVPPVGPVPVALDPEGPPAWARIILSLSADACAANGRAKAPATATANNVLSFIAIS